MRERSSINTGAHHGRIPRTIGGRCIPHDDPTYREQHARPPSVDNVRVEQPPR